MPANIYKNGAGKRLPSVTTILSRFKDSGGLLYWANQAGLDGKTLDEARAPACTAGTIAHEMIEARLRRQSYILPPDLSLEVATCAKTSFENYLNWERNNKLTLKYAEVSLVSEKYQFGGQLDAIGEMDGKLVLVDWKTSNAIYGDYLIQLAAYRALWEEAYPEKPIEGGFYLCRFAKETGDFATHYFTSLDKEWQAFLLMLELYRIDKDIKKRAA